MKPKVSVVVPIFRVEKYLEQCVDSLLKQTLCDIEIILVDDGSPDRCGEIADAFAVKDARIKVLHQDNSGVGPARNAGMAMVSGEYIGFVDSDDWVRPEMYEKLYNVAVSSDADIVVSGHCDVTSGKITTVKVHPLNGKVFTDRTEILQIRKNLYGHTVSDSCVEAFPMSVWTSLYRKSFVDENALLFSNILSEDTIFNLLAYQCAKRIAFTSDVDYRYRKDEQPSITRTFSVNKLGRFREFLVILKLMASKEYDQDCIMRAKRTAIDYCRLYVDVVGKTSEPFRNKKRYVQAFAQDIEIRACWDGYPIRTLPLQQRIFHKAIENGWYGCALFMNWIRQLLKKGRAYIYGCS